MGASGCSRKTRSTAARYSSTFFGLTYELVNGSRIGEGAFGVEPPLLHAKDRIAADLFRICRKQRVVEALQLSSRGSRTAL